MAARRAAAKPPPKAGEPGAPAPKALQPKGPPKAKPKTQAPPPVPKLPSSQFGVAQPTGIQSIIQSQAAGAFTFAAPEECVNYNAFFAMTDLAQSISAEISQAPVKLTQLANHPLYLIAQTGMALDMHSKPTQVSMQPEWPTMCSARRLSLALRP